MKSCRQVVASVTSEISVLSGHWTKPRFSRVPKAKPLTNEEFLRCVCDYLPMDAVVWNLNGHGRCGSLAQVTGLEENHFYLFDGESILAASHAIEELALEEAKGSLLAVMQDFQHFEPHRERYWQLAATLDRVRVIGKGRRRPSHDHLKFITTRQRTLLKYWAVSYEGPRASVMLIGRQHNQAAEFEQKQFIGFYTFDAKLIASMRQNVEDILSARSPVMREFERLLTIDQAARETGLRFDRELRNVEAAFHKLRLNGNRYRPRDLAAAIERSLGRLRRFAGQLPARVGAEHKSDLND